MLRFTRRSDTPRSSLGCSPSSCTVLVTLAEPLPTANTTDVAVVMLLRICFSLAVSPVSCLAAADRASSDCVRSIDPRALRPPVPLRAAAAAAAGLLVEPSSAALRPTELERAKAAWCCFLSAAAAAASLAASAAAAGVTRGGARGGTFFAAAVTGDTAAATALSGLGGADTFGGGVAARGDGSACFAAAGSLPVLTDGRAVMAFLLSAGTSLICAAGAAVACGFSGVWERGAS